MKTIILFLTILFAAGLISSRSQDTWTQKADVGGTARHLAVGFSIGSKGYIGTGNGSGGGLHRDFWEYDPVTNVWTQKSDYGGNEIQGAVAFSIGSKGYVGTGMGYSGFTNNFWEYDPSTNNWSQKANFEGPLRISAVGFSIGEKGYLGTGIYLGGGTQIVYKDFWEYDPSSDTWTQKSDYGGNETFGAVGFAITDKGYIGTGASVYGFTSDLWEYDPNTDIWTQKASFGGASRYYAVGFSTESKGYIGTGYAADGLKNDFWEYNPGSNTWTQCADVGGQARSHAVGFSIDGKGYIGTGNNTISSLSDFWLYTPEEETICTIPGSLSSTKITSTSASLNWDDVAGVEGYAVHYRVVGSDVSTMKSTTSNSKKLSGLTPATSYMWQVKTFCSTVPPALSSDWSTQQFFTTGSLKLGEEQLTTLNVYPNPTSGQFKIAITLGDEEASSAIIQVINSLGQIMYNEKTSVANGMLLKEIQLNALPAGMYLVRVTVNDEVYSAPIIFQK